MPRKRVWLSWLPADGDVAAIQATIKTLSKAGLEAGGSIWNRDLVKVGWAETAAQLTADDAADLWLIVGARADLDDIAVRYGLSLTAASIAAKRTRPLPILVAGLDFAPSPEALPRLLHDARALSPPAGSWGAHVVAAALRPPAPQTQQGFSLSVIAHPSLGQWFEIGPAAGARWQGILFGVDGGEITHQGVGPSRELPERCTLEYPSQGIRIDVGGRDYSCWAVRNVLEDGQSYFARVIGAPARIVFGELPEQDEAELHVLELV